MTPTLHHYFLYGLQIASEYPLEDIQEAAVRAQPDIRIYDGTMPDGLEVESPLWQPQNRFDDSRQTSEGEQAQQIRLSADGQFIQFRIWHAATVVFEASGSAMWIRWAGEGHDDIKTFNILGPLLGFLLHLRGITPLHASAISVHGRAVLFMGASGAGKSTTVAAFAQAGYPVIADDICACHDQGGVLTVAPGHARVRLLQDAASALTRRPDGALIEVHGRQKWNVSFHSYPPGEGGIVQAAYLPIARVYWLAEREPVVRAEGMTGVNALINVMRNIYLWFLMDIAMQKRAMLQANRLIKQVPFYQLHAPQGHDRLSELIAFVDRAVGEAGT
ncbi:MAG: hypothetical protein JNL42_16240 [Anaerolineae bacterium]|nr:hypothetical protein [Anaerolineae bacterium]